VSLFVTAHGQMSSLCSRRERGSSVMHLCSTFVLEHCLLLNYFMLSLRIWCAVRCTVRSL
jgi:hypothetical protein